MKLNEKAEIALSIHNALTLLWAGNLDLFILSLKELIRKIEKNRGEYK